MDRSGDHSGWRDRNAEEIDVNGCGVTTGFFVLKQCGVLAVTSCARCARPLCAAHVAEGGCCPESARWPRDTGHCPPTAQ